MSNIQWTTIHVSLAFMALSVIVVGVAESSDKKLRDTEDGAMGAMSASCLEDDFVTVAGPTGPWRGALAGDGRDGRVANAAAVRHFADDRAREQALDVLKGAMTRQATSRGFIGAELGASRKCGTVRLLSVWDDEPSMLRGTTSSAFLGAMDQAASGGATSAMIAWKKTASEPRFDWQAARDKLAGASELF